MFGIVFLLTLWLVLSIALTYIVLKTPARNEREVITKIINFLLSVASLAADITVWLLFLGLK